MNGKDIDQVTGVETTGHVWDGIKELNKPLPRWWTWTFCACIVWAIGYMILYPAFPTLASYTKGTLGYSQRAEVTREVSAGQASQATFRDAIAKAALGDIRNNQELSRFAMAGGAAAFATNCAPCHGRGGQGFAGYPNLQDDDWLWGGKIDDIYQTIRFGIRSGHPNARFNQMPRFGIDGLLDANQMNDVAEYVLSLTGRGTDATAARRGKDIFAEQCVTCHSDSAGGNQQLGAPNLTDALWLYGSDKATILESIRTGRGGVMPTWEGRLDPITIKSLAVYVYSLGGGQ